MDLLCLALLMRQSEYAQLQSGARLSEVMLSPNQGRRHRH